MVERHGFKHAAAVALLAACCGSPLVVNAQSSTPNSASGIFKAKCAMCHGADLSGNTPMGEKLSVPDLRSPEVQNQPDAELTSTITKGMKKMPAFGGKLSNEDIAKLVAYLREMARKH